MSNIIENSSCIAKRYQVLVFWTDMDGVQLFQRFYYNDYKVAVNKIEELVNEMPYDKINLICEARYEIS